MSLVIHGAEVGGRTGMGLRAAGGVICELGPHVRPGVDDVVVDAAGGAVIAGLHDHHVHVRAAAAARCSVDCGPTSVAGPDELRAALATDPGVWVRAVGYHESVAGALDCDVLDRLATDHPVRVQHRSGVLWMCNSAALRALPLASAPEGVVEQDAGGRPTGRLWRGDAWLATALPSPELDLAAIGELAAQRGITGLTDADPRRTQADAERLRTALPQRLHVMGPLDLSFVEDPRVTLGPVKVVLDDHDLPALGDLVELIDASHRSGRAVAVHCVTRVQLVLTVAALSTAGAFGGDRVEHASVVPPELLGELRRLAIVVVTQPTFVHERGDAYLADVEADDQPNLYRVRTLLEAGVGVAFGTDAPHGDADPWRSMARAVSRRTAGGEVLGAGERVSAARALALFQGSATAPHRPRRVEVGAPADLCVLSAPLAAVLADPSAAPVAATVVAGELVHRAT